MGNKGVGYSVNDEKYDSADSFTLRLAFLITNLFELDPKINDRICFGMAVDPEIQCQI